MRGAIRLDKALSPAFHGTAAMSVGRAAPPPLARPSNTASLICLGLDLLSVRGGGAPVGAQGTRTDPLDLTGDGDDQPPAGGQPPAAAGPSTPAPRASTSSSSSAAIATVDVPARDVVGVALQIRESGIVPGQPGLFATDAIPANAYVATYTYDRVVSTRDPLVTGRPGELNKYAVGAHGRDGPVTLLLDPPVDGARHPAAMANEPKSKTSANLELHGGVVVLPNGKEYHILALYACKTPIAANEELCWNYGRSGGELHASLASPARAPPLCVAPLASPAGALDASQFV